MAGTAQNPYNDRQRRDNTFYTTKVMPIAANTVNGAVFDLGRTPYPINESIKLKITVASTNMNGTNANFRIMDSADNVTYANVAAVGNPILVAATNAAATVTIGLGGAPALARYIQVTCLGETNGTANRGNFVAELLF